MEGWIQEKGNCIPRGGGDGEALAAKSDASEVQECATQCTDDEKCGTFTVAGPGTQKDPKCTFFPTSYAGNEEDGYLCYISREKAKKAGVLEAYEDKESDVSASSADEENETARGPEGAPGPRGPKGKDLKATPYVIPALVVTFLGNIVFSAVLFQMAKKELMKEETLSQEAEPDSPQEQPETQEEPQTEGGLEPAPESNEAAVPAEADAPAGPDAAENQPPPA